jgi:hypothetical protein
MRNRPFVLLVSLLLLDFVLLAYPIYVIRPFRFQGARELAAALLVTQYRSVVELVLVLFAIFTVILAWRNASRFQRISLVLLTLLICACAVLSRINVYEKMFHPLDSPSFSAAAGSKLDANEQVIAVVVSKTARAYPIRIISYHHIVNDTLGGRAIVATY